MARLSAVDLLPDVFEVEDQGALGSCTANAGLSALELMYKRAGQPRDFSRLYLYYWERRNMGRAGDTGADPRQITRVLTERGVCLEETWPYDPALLDVAPSAEAEAEAPLFRIYGSERLQLAVADLDTIIERIRASLCAGIPVLQTSALTRDFWSLRDQKDWRTQHFDDRSGEYNPVMGSHQTLIIGYDDAVQMFLCQNSWGPQWADGGFFGVPYDCMGRAWIQALFFLTDAGVRAIPVPDLAAPPIPNPPPPPPPEIVPEPVIAQPQPVTKQDDPRLLRIIAVVGLLALAALIFF